MQQLFSAFGVSWKLLFAQAVNFSIVLIALWYFLYKPVLAMLEKRKSIVEKGVRDAEEAQKLFASAHQEAAERVKEADHEAETILVNARESAKKERTQRLQEAEKQAALVTKTAEDRATESIARAHRESEQDIARLAILAAEKILQQHD